MEVKGNQGRLFKNDRKTDEKHADYKGSWTAEDGREYFLDGYINLTKNGDKYIKLRLGKEKQAYQANKPAIRAVDSKQFLETKFEESDVPF